MIADKDGIIEEKEYMINLVNKENEELTRENQVQTASRFEGSLCDFRGLFVHLYFFCQSFKSDIDGLRRLCTDLHAAPPADSHVQPDPTSSPAHHEWQQPETPEQAENLYETIGE